jgi:hypothetical protein
LLRAQFLEPRDDVIGVQDRDRCVGYRHDATVTRPLRLRGEQVLQTRVEYRVGLGADDAHASIGPASFSSS